MTTTAWTRINVQTRQPDGTIAWEGKDVLFKVEIDVDRLVDDMKHRAYFSTRKTTTKAAGAIVITQLQEG